MSMLFHFDLELAAESSNIALEEVVGNEALLGLLSDTGGNGGERWIHGVVNEVAQLETRDKLTIYRASVVPSVWRLDQGRDSRIFQNQDIESIICGLLKKARIKHSFRVKGALEKREYCVQYRESDWAFISRLLEEEGFYYYFEHRKYEHDKYEHVLHMADGVEFYPDIPDSKTVSLHAPDSMEPGAEHITDFNVRQRLCPERVTLSDFNFKKPSLDLKSKDPAQQESGVEIYDYPGLYEEPDSGEKLAGVRLDEARAAGTQAEGTSTCPRFAAGHLFNLEDHPRKDLNNKPYLLTRVVHEVTKSAGADTGALDRRCQYANVFLCVPGKVRFRPPQITPKPMVRGVQTAIVTGPDREEIYTDEHGRVKVQFHWDREGAYDDKSSCWIRVSQVWAGQGFGAMWIPRMGHEVIVDFLEGDPDRPIITGRVYHAQNPPPYELPKDKTKSTIKSESSPGGKGFNEVRFEDKKGKEELYTHAQRNQTEVVNANMSTSVGANQSLSVGGDRSKSVVGKETLTVEKDQTEKVEGAQTLTVTKDRTKKLEANEIIEVDGDESLTVGGNERAEVTGDRTVVVGKNLTVKVTGNQVEIVDGSAVLKARDVTIQADSSVTVKCGGSTITVTGGAVEVKGGMVKLN